MAARLTITPLQKLAFQTGRSDADIAAAEGVSKSAIRMRRHRALRKIPSEFAAQLRRYQPKARGTESA